MATDSSVKERSVPKPQFTDAEAGALEFPSSKSRSFNYFTSPSTCSPTPTAG